MRLLQAPVPSDDHVVLEFGSNTVGWAWAWTAFFGLVWIRIGVGAAFDGSPGVSVFLLPLGGLCGFVGLLLYRTQHLRTVLTTTRLILPRYVWGWDVVELRSVAGLGLRFYDPPPPRIKGEGGRVRPMWRLAVWRIDVSRVALPLGVFSGDPPPLPSAPDPEDLLVLSQPLADSWPGQVARQIAEQVAAASAPGPSELDEHRYEASAPGLHAENAYWSPDGSMGLLR